MPVGKSGPLAKFITEDIYVSAVGLAQIEAADGEVVKATEPASTEESKEERQFKYSADKKITQTTEKDGQMSLLTKIGMGAGKVVNTFYQIGRAHV